ncbi:MAG: amidohydrolase family protein [Gammaproteobacteria bacterium]|nr:amidohydrolase family protein [Gammaproteobacteria bacterium]
MNDKLGFIEPGKLADLVVIRGDPIKDIKITRNIKYTVKKGIVYDPAVLGTKINTL